LKVSYHGIVRVLATLAIPFNILYILIIIFDPEVLRSIQWRLPLIFILLYSTIGIYSLIEERE
jgi:uncharacterized MAPEG superfamily protein